MHNALGLAGWTVVEIRDTEIMREYHATCDAQPAACPKCGKRGKPTPTQERTARGEL